VQPFRHYGEDGAHESEAECVILLAGMPQAGAIESQRMHFFESAGLKLFPSVTGYRRPSEDFTGY
jgi:hypothetical protein